MSKGAALEALQETENNLDLYKETESRYKVVLERGEVISSLSMELAVNVEKLRKVLRFLPQKNVRDLQSELAYDAANLTRALDQFDTAMAGLYGIFDSENPAPRK